MAFLYWKAYWDLEGFFTFLNIVKLVENTRGRINKLKWLCSYRALCREMNGYVQRPIDCHRVILQELLSAPLCVILSCVPQSRMTWVTQNTWHNVPFGGGMCLLQTPQNNRVQLGYSLVLLPLFGVLRFESLLTGLLY